HRRPAGGTPCHHRESGSCSSFHPCSGRSRRRELGERLLELAQFFPERCSCLARLGQIAFFSELLDAQSRLGSPPPAEAPCRSFERVGGALQRWEVAGLESSAHLREAERAVFEEEGGQFLKELHIAGNERDQRSL